MANLIINSITFSGLPSGAGNASAWQPDGYSPAESKIGITLVAADGTRKRVERGTVKRTWALDWKATNLATMQTIRTISRLTTSFTFIDFEGSVYTVATEDAFTQGWAFNSVTGVSFWTVTLMLYEQ